MSITKNVSLKWYPSMKKIFRKFWIIFDIENWLWKSEIGTFGQLIFFYQWPKLGLGLDVGCGSWNSNLKSHLHIVERYLPYNLKMLLVINFHLIFPSFDISRIKRKFKKCKGPLNYLVNHGHWQVSRSCGTSRVL